MIQAQLEKLSMWKRRADKFSERKRFICGRKRSIHRARIYKKYFSRKAVRIAEKYNRKMWDFAKSDTELFEAWIRATIDEIAD